MTEDMNFKMQFSSLVTSLRTIVERTLPTPKAVPEGPQYEDISTWGRWITDEPYILRTHLSNHFEVSSHTPEFKEVMVWCEAAAKASRSADTSALSLLNPLGQISLDRLILFSKKGKKTSKTDLSKVCFFCNAAGHLQKDCRKKAAEEAKKSKAETDKPKAPGGVKGAVPIV